MTIELDHIEKSIWRSTAFFALEVYPNLKDFGYGLESLACKKMNYGHTDFYNRQ